jgi:hypothetical protein
VRLPEADRDDGAQRPRLGRLHEGQALSRRPAERERDKLVRVDALSDRSAAGRKVNAVVALDQNSR